MISFSFTDGQIFALECVLFSLAAGGYLLWLLGDRLKRRRPELAIGSAIAGAFAARVLGTFAVEQTSIAQELRGGDELLFIEQAGELSDTAIGSESSTDALTSELHTFVFSLFDRAFGTIGKATPELMVRIGMIALAVAGLALLAAAVYDLAGARAAVIAAWILALEPTNVFFSGILHKEPLMLLAEGLLAIGGARLWKRGGFIGVVPLVLGCLIAVATRPYVGWFFLAGAAAVALHAAVTRGADRSLALLATAILFAGVFVPIAWNKSSDEELQGLQTSQEANTNDDDANLSLEEVDYSTRIDVITNLPKRVRDVVLRPYPWQLQNTSQRLGLLGTVVVLAGLWLLAAALVRNRSGIMQRAGPLIYPAIFALIAYSLSAGNAGTAFRYRMHVVAFMLCVIVILRQHRAEERAERIAPTPLRRLTAAPTTGQLR